MKAISTLVTLLLIITTCATSAVLYLNENYNISAALSIVWIVSLTMWIGKSTGLKLYPNPATENVFLELPGTQPSSVTIVNSSGQKVYQKSYSGNHVEISLQSFSRGIYKVIVTQDDKRYVEQLSRQ